MAVKTDPQKKLAKKKTRAPASPPPTMTKEGAVAKLFKRLQPWRVRGRVGRLHGERGGSRLWRACRCWGRCLFALPPHGGPGVLTVCRRLCAGGCALARRTQIESPPFFVPPLSPQVTGVASTPEFQTYLPQTGEWRKHAPR